MSLQITKTIIVKEQDIDDIMVTALEGGINYWCDGVVINSNPTYKEYASEIIADGGELRLYEIDGGQFLLTRNMILKGIDKAMDHFGYDSFEKFMDEHDATTADVVVQFAIFDKIVYG
jgi:hypothetical protein